MSQGKLCGKKIKIATEFNSKNTIEVSCDLYEGHEGKCSKGFYHCTPIEGDKHFTHNHRLGRIEWDKKFQHHTPTTDQPRAVEHNCDNCKYEHDDHSFNCNKCDELFCMWEAKPVEYDCDTCKHYPCVGLGGDKITKGLCGDYKKKVKMNITHFTERDDDEMSAEDVLVKTYGCIDVDELKRCFITDNISITLIKEAMEQYKTNL